jgi:DNA-binding HxlR family transcriptional regulator
MSGLQRYGDILENCRGISPNLLSARLKRLEAEGLIERRYFRELPPRVEYRITEKGWAVRPVLTSLIQWASEHFGPISPEALGEAFTTDFAVRVVPTFSFHPDRAEDLSATMTIEIAGCDDCNSWTFDIHDGHLHPRRHAEAGADVHLRTDSQGFFRFIRGEAPPAHCGELVGDPAIAASIQACFLLS